MKRKMKGKKENEEREKWRKERIRVDGKVKREGNKIKIAPACKLT